MPKFSIIVPVYNVEPYIRECIDSILAQIYGDYEAIFVNDGSTDASAIICEEYARIDKRIKVLHKENGGLVSARQAGVQEAHGTYCVAIDSDDWIKPSYLSEFSAIIDKYDPDIICSGLELVDGTKIKIMMPPLDEGYYNREQIEKLIFPRLIQSSKAERFEPNICSKAIRRELYVPYQLSVNTKIRNGEDSACTIPCFYHSQSVYILKECNYCYRYNRESMTKGLKPMPWSQQEILAAQLLKNVDISKYDFRDQLNRRICHGLFNICVSQFYSKRKYTTIRKEINKNLTKKLYKEAIGNAVFTSPKARFMLFALKKRFVLLMFLYAIIKRK